jgi:hypothetical protein
MHKSERDEKLTYRRWRRLLDNRSRRRGGSASHGLEKVTEEAKEEI